MRVIACWSRACAIAFAALYLGPSSQTHAQTTTQAAASSSAAQDEKDPVANFSMFGLRIGMSEADAAKRLGELSNSADCASPALAPQYLPGLDDACWKSTTHRESERILAKDAHASAALRAELEGRWSALLRVFYTGKPSDSPNERMAACERLAVETESKVYRIEWLVYWVDKDLWLVAARDRMRDKILSSVRSAVGSLPRSREILDHGVTHRYVWKARVVNENKRKTKSYIAFDISYPPQLSLVVSRGECDEIYAPRVIQLKQQQVAQERREKDERVNDFLSDDVPRLPSPPGAKP
jgi:hypothetical protein